jgi:hypothetical protein
VSLFERDLFTGTCRQCRGLGARPATLGCGTLLLIGIVVALFTRSGFQNMERRLERVEHSADSLRAEIAQQTIEIRQLRSTIEGSRTPGAAKSR